jgi:Uma2 family endonuclease
MTPSEALEKREWTLQEWLEAELEPLFEYEDGRLIPMAAPTKRHQDIVGLTFTRCAALFVRTGWAQCYGRRCGAFAAARLHP